MGGYLEEIPGIVPEIVGIIRTLILKGSGQAGNQLFIMREPFFPPHHFTRGSTASLPPRMQRAFDASSRRFMIPPVCP
jgi:hypothetical protein